MASAPLLIRDIAYGDAFAAFRRFADLPGAVFLDSGHVTEHTAADDFFRSPHSLQAKTFLEGERL